MRVGLWLAIGAALGVASGEESREETIVYTTLAPAAWDLYLFEGPERSPRRLTTDVALDYNGVFSPDGRWVVFTSERRGNPDLFALDLRSQGPPRPLTDSEAMEDAPAFSPDGRVLTFVSDRDGDADVFVMPFRPESPAASSGAVNLTRQRGGDFNPAFSPDGRMIAFSSDRDTFDHQLAEHIGSTGESEIYVINADGSAPRRLTHQKGWDGSPVWSADGRTLYSYAERGEDLRIWRMSVDGSDARPLSPAGLSAVSPLVMPNGRVGFVVEKDGQSQVLSVAADGSDQRLESGGQRDCRAPAFDGRTGRLLCHGRGPLPEGLPMLSSGSKPFAAVSARYRVRLPDRVLEIQGLHAHFPSLSPDGTEVVSAQLVTTKEADGTELVVSRVDGTLARRIFKPADPAFAWAASWSGDGRWIAFTLGPPFAPPSAVVDIWRVQPDGRGAANLTGGSKGNNAFPDFSGDGRRIVFRSGRDGDQQIYVMDADGANLRRLPKQPASLTDPHAPNAVQMRLRNTMPAFSRQGDRIAFSSGDRGGAVDFEIWLVDLGPSGEAASLRRLTESPGPDMHPRFSPDGKWLVFASVRGGYNDERPLDPGGPQPDGELWVMPIQGGPAVRLTHNKWEDSLPSWARPRR